MSMLAIPLRRSASNRFAGITPEQVLETTSKRRVSELLARVPTEVELYELDAGQADQHIGPYAPASERYWWLRQDAGLKPTTTFNLLARKRPRLLPVSETQVRAALRAKKPSWWMPVWEALRTTDGLVDRAHTLAREADATRLSVLRIVDVEIWMRVRGTHQCPCPLPVQPPV